MRLPGGDLSGRDMRELASLTASPRVAGARAFERHGVVVHLHADFAEGAKGRPAGAPAPPGADAGGAHGQSARQEPTRTTREQWRFERGQRRKEQRKQGNNNRPLESMLRLCSRGGSLRADNWSIRETQGVFRICCFGGSDRGGAPAGRRGECGKG